MNFCLFFTTFGFFGHKYDGFEDIKINKLADDREKFYILPILEEVYGRKERDTWFQRWRIFFMACAELFAYKSGNQWFVAHYLFKKKS